MIVFYGMDASQGGRETQQDRRAACFSHDSCLFVVADGMGGHRGGELAAQAVVETAERVFQAWDGEDAPGVLARIVAEVHRAINAVGRAHDLTPRSTAVFLLLTGNQAHWAHVGDCRLYHFRRGRLVSRTRDHSVVQHLVDLGELREEEMANHPDQNRLLASLGGEREHAPTLAGARLRNDDGFLLCSDGLWERVTVKEMAAALAMVVEPPAPEQDVTLTSDPMQRSARSLVATAAERGGEGGDNVSLVLARVWLGEESRGLAAALEEAKERLGGLFSRKR